MAHGEGRAAVMADAVKGAERAIARDRTAADGEQLPMFALHTRLDGAEAEQLQQKRERGRPPGAQNLATRAFREYLVGRGVDPHTWMMRWLLHSPDTLAAELGCSRLEAFDRLKDLAAELAPYIRGKALPVDDEGKAVPFMQLVVGASAGVAIGEGEKPWEAGLRAAGVPLPKIVENQQLAAPANDVSHAGQSHGEVK